MIAYLETALNAIPASQKVGNPPQQVEDERSKKSDILEELLHLVRDQHKIMSNPDRVLPPEYLEYVFDRSRGFKSSGIQAKNNHLFQRELIKFRDIIESVDCTDEVRDLLETHFMRVVK